MLKRSLPIILACLLVNLLCYAPAAADVKVTPAEAPARVKAEVARLGVGPAARVEVRLRDKTKLKGYVSAAGEESFTVTDAKTGAATVVAYPQVAKVKGNNLSTGAKVALVVVGLVAIFLVVALIWREADER